MRKYILLLLGIFIVAACDKHDPILPGVRTAIFDTDAKQNILNANVPDLPDTTPEYKSDDCEYSLDSKNTIRDSMGNKIFVGFASPNSVDIKTNPLCAGGYVYAGLNTGNVVKVAPKKHSVIWMADVYSETNMMGGATTVDIVAPLVLDGAYIYAGGMGDAFCKINTESGNKKWCVSVGTRFPFVVLPNVAYVMGMDNALYAIRVSDGAIYWRSDIIKKPNTPIYCDKKIYIGKKIFNAENGEPTK